jgi:xanthine/uracil permease
VRASISISRQTIPDQIASIATEIFGSPFFRNCSAITGLLLGYIVAAGTNYGGSKYVTNANFENAPDITFLWTTSFPLGFYAPAIIPMVIVATITSIETVGDTTATMEASRLPTLGPLYVRRIQGALLNDAVSGLFSALATSLPLTTFAQNNGVITLTNVASRQAGWWCAGFLFLLGCLGKFGAWVVSIPNCVLGGMTTFLFANIISSGIKIIVTQGNMDRRTRFIMACALALGVGVELYPQWASTWLWPITPDKSSALLGVRQAIIIVLTTSFCIGAITAFILNLMMPEESIDPGQTAYEAQTDKLRAVEIMGLTAAADEPSVAPVAAKGAWTGAVAEGAEDLAPTQPVMTV